MAATPTPKRVLAAIPDLFWGSKVSGTASQLGIEVQFATTRAAVLALAAKGPDLILLDLDAPAVEPLATLRELQARPASGRPPLVAFASHVHGPALAQARAGGCDRVLSRARLNAELPRLLRDL